MSIKKEKVFGSKRYRKAKEFYAEALSYSLVGALDKIAGYADKAKAKFDETVELIVKLGVDPKQTDQMVRGAVPLPHGLGKNIRVAVITKPAQVKEAKEAGADLFGSDELIDTIKSGKLDFDVLITTPDMMAAVSKLGKVLGPKGLMPNPKLGTVSDDIEQAVKLSKAGRVEFKLEKAGIVHVPVGKISFLAQKDTLIENIKALYNALLAAKPANSKGIYIRGAFLCTTQGPSLKLDLDKILG